MTTGALRQAHTQQDFRSAPVSSGRLRTVEEKARVEARLYGYDDGRTRMTRDGVKVVTIRGQVTPARRRTAASVAVHRYGASPDRAAMWAVMLGIFMVALAVATGS